MPTTVRSHAKINLGLYIGAPRSDGFHPLATVYQTIELHDYVTVTAHPASETSIRLTSNDPRVPTDSRNTAWKMVALALEDLATPASVSIFIDKRLPIQGGLGAGSANAIAALVALETELRPFREDVLPDGAGRTSWLDIRQFAEKMGVPELDSPMFNVENWPSNQINLAAKVGSDVPLFLIGGAVLGRGRGEVVYPLPDLDPTWCLIATPPIGVSTPQAFRDWDALCAREGLTVDASEDRLEQLSRAYASAFSEAMHGKGSSGVPGNDRDLAGPQESALVRTGITSWIQNDFERVVFPQHPSLAQIKRLLAADETPEAALHASLSGSGSALFGLYLTREHAQAAQQRLTAAGVQSQLTQTLPRSKYWSEMIVE
ncbi:4-(cytidine 5'-diphospho)-2-C-methyl-D-erythritol kinase [Occallatibacter savannae]|uniref:4-(cytidine 5'-diphospho)-2-C-methyl-D-erythritol kinase n=1 Tax=Occallatibacter savannae TaxID=1002691 RepID=UPI000D69D8F7|nr:4-(cytidine 5'-diphospho)-2-C-methyl-D-erythritol kinase [Occallatibacter savannae]